MALAFAESLHNASTVSSGMVPSLNARAGDSIKMFYDTGMAFMSKDPKVIDQAGPDAQFAASIVGRTGCTTILNVECLSPTWLEVPAAKTSIPCAGVVSLV